MVVDHKLRCPECQGTCEHADLWKTFWSADGNAEASETEEDGSLVRARRLLRLRMRLQRAEHEAAAATKALTESRESGANTTSEASCSLLCCSVMSPVGDFGPGAGVRGRERE